MDFMQEIFWWRVFESESVVRTDNNDGWGMKGSKKKERRKKICVYQTSIRDSYPHIQTDIDTDIKHTHRKRR